MQHTPRLLLSQSALLVRYGGGASPYRNALCCIPFDQAVRWSSVAECSKRRILTGNAPINRGQGIPPQTPARSRSLELRSVAERFHKIFPTVMDLTCCKKLCILDTFTGVRGFPLRGPSIRCIPSGIGLRFAAGDPIQRTDGASRRPTGSTDHLSRAVDRPLQEEVMTWRPAMPRDRLSRRQARWVRSVSAG